MPVDLTRSGPSWLDRPSSQDVQDGASMLEAGAEVVHDGIGSRGAVVMVAVDILKIIPGFKVARTPARGSLI